jgi:hypothetical protein
LVERSPEKAGVGGSIPSLATITSSYCFTSIHFLMLRFRYRGLGIDHESLLPLSKQKTCALADRSPKAFGVDQSIGRRWKAIHPHPLYTGLYAGFDYIQVLTINAFAPSEPARLPTFLVPRRDLEASPNSAPKTPYSFARGALQKTRTVSFFPYE